MVDLFDEDGSGELEGEERKKAGEWMMENRPFRLMHYLKGKHGNKGDCKKGEKKEKKEE
jgi:hypothetical protein